MNFLDSKIYRTAELLTSLIMLNLLWLLACIPIVTIFPATAAMFGVVRDWIRGSDSGVVEPFVRHLKANFVQGLGIGLLWSALGAILAVDFLAIRGMESWLRLPLFLALGIGLISYTFTSVYLFPVMVNYESRWWRVIKNAFLISISQLGTTILCLLVVGVVLLALIYLPLALLLAGSGTALILYFLCSRAFRRIEALKGVES